MYIHGEFVNKNGNIIAVHIVTLNDRSEEIVIGDDGSDIQFTDAPVEITGEVNDTFDPILPYQATLHLQTRRFLNTLFTSSHRDSVVNIFRDGVCVFAGFIEPRAYSQGFNEAYDVVDVTCIDVTGALKYAKYLQIGSAGITYESAKQNGGQRTFLEIINECMSNDALDVTGGHVQHLYYDGSKGIDNTDRYSLLERVSINDLLFLEDDESSVWTYEKVVQELLRYLGLHAVQVGFDVFIFSWESVKSPSAIKWKDLISDEVMTTDKTLTTVSVDNVDGTGTAVSIGETYNRIKVKCDTKSMSDMIESPLDSETLMSPFSGVQPYLKEFMCDDEKSGFLAAYDLIHEFADNNEHSKIMLWYMQVKNSLHWRFGAKDTDLVAQMCTDGINQQELPNYLSKNPGAAVISFGSVERKFTVGDIRPQAKLSMTDCLFLSVNGNENDDKARSYPQEADIKANIPYATYTGGVGGGVFSPPDDATTNYIIFSGSMILNPIVKESGRYGDMRNSGKDELEHYVKSWANRVDGRDNTRFYTRQWFKAEHPSDDAVWDESNSGGLMPYSSDSPQYYEFKHAEAGDDVHYDAVDKVGMLACMLIIGDKCAVELTGSGKLGDIVWKPYKERKDCASDDEYYQQSFTLGINPKIGDKIIGTEFDLQNNVNYKMNLDEEGTAIPVKRSDRLNGKVQFVILGPVNAVWSDVIRRHKTFFRRLKWKTNSVPLLAHISSIIIKKFEVKVCSDNGKLTGHGDKDLIYVSDTDERFVNAKDDISFKLDSALTVKEREALGVGGDVNISTPVNINTGNGLLTVYDFNIKEEAKPEQLYVNSAYKEWHVPRVMLTQDFKDVGKTVSPWGVYQHPALGLKMFAQSISRDLGEGIATVTLKDSSQV